MKFLNSPVRNLLWIAIFMIVMMFCATLAYMAAGWSLRDAFYMVVVTVYSVGYQEVRPVDTPYLLTITVSTIILGCTGMILLTSALVQFLTLTQLQQLFGLRRVQTEIDKLRDHTIIAGFGRIGSMVARELSAGAANFIVIESDEKRVGEARARLLVPARRCHR